mgnify:FL=1
MITRIKNEPKPYTGGSTNSFFVIENALLQNQVQSIADTLLSLQFPWNYTADTTYNSPDHRQQRPGFIHWFHKEGRASNYVTLLQPIIEAGAMALNLREVDVMQARAFLQLPLNPKVTGDEIDSPHIDLYEPHWVFLYYVKDCHLGDTVIYKNTYDGGEPPFFHELKEATRITPKAGTLVVFDGKHWHTAEQPKQDVRTIININIKK